MGYLTDYRIHFLQHYERKTDKEQGKSIKTQQKKEN
jgi:hypothetical protein